MFFDEKSLVNQFVLTLQSTSSPWGNLKIASEFFYQRGRTDIVALSSTGEVIAFEAKLKKWKIALQQAYRNRCFADLSYVLLPQDSVHNAYKHLDEFVIRRVGLCCFSEDVLEVLYDAPQTKPLQPWLRDQAVLHVSSEGG